MNASVAKAQQRQHFHDTRQEALPKVEARIVEQVAITLLRNSQAEVQGTHIGLYWPLRGEPDLRPLRQRLDMAFALPACGNQGDLHYHDWGNIRLRKDHCGIPAPLDERRLPAESIRLLLIPCLAVDKGGIRLGYGGGFYDRLLSNNKWGNIPALAVLPQACVADHALPRDSWDVPLTGWITENGQFAHPEQGWCQ